MHESENASRPMKLFTESVPQLRATELISRGSGEIGFAIEGRGLRMVADVTLSDREVRIELYRDAGRERIGVPDTFEVGLKHARAGAAGERTVFACPNCGAPTDVIYLHRENWACRKCHGLHYRSQYMPQEQKNTQEYERLLGEVQGGRKRYERQSSWDSKVARLRELESLPKYGRIMRKDQSRLTYTTVYDLFEYDSDNELQPWSRVFVRSSMP